MIKSCEDCPVQNDCPIEKATGKKDFQRCNWKLTFDEVGLQTPLESK